MTGWSHGYDVSVGYTYGFGREMAPGWLELCARVAGWRPPESGARRRYLDLGCGQGMGLCLLAAACPELDFVGIDFHPEHIAHADGLAAAAALTNVHFAQADFLELAQDWPAALGTFDQVVMHGISSWVSPEVRAAVIRCLAHATRPGSLVYNSYNSQPGWLATMPFQHITQRIKAGSDRSGREVIDESIALFDRLRAGGADTFRILPGLGAQIDAVKTKNSAYLSGEYLSEHWSPFWHSEMAAAFAGAGFGYLGPATMAETMLPDLLPPPLRDAVLAQDDPGLREDVQDFVINQSFRRDIYCRGPWPNAGRQLDALGDVRLLLAERPAGDTLAIKAAFGEITLKTQMLGELLAKLTSGATIAELAALPSMRGQGQANVTQMALLLLHAGVLAIAAETSGGDPALRLNRVIAERVAEGMPYDFLAAPAIGSAIGTTREDLLSLHRLLSDPTETATTADHFSSRTLPRWRSMGAVS